MVRPHGPSLLLLAAVVLLAVATGHVQAQTTAADESYGHALLLTDYSRVACVAHGTPTFHLRFRFVDAELDETHTFRLKVYDAGDEDRAALPDFQVTSPSDGTVLNGTLPWGYFPSLVGVWQYITPGVEDEGGVRTVDVTLELPQRAGLYGLGAELMDTNHDRDVFLLPSFAVDPEPEASGPFLEVLPAERCHGRFFPRGPGFWKEGGRGWLMWDGIAGNANHRPWDMPAEDVMLCQPGCCGDRPSCFLRGEQPPSTLIIGDFSADGQFGVEGEGTEVDSPSGPDFRNLGYLDLSLEFARGMINGDDSAFEDYYTIRESEAEGLKYGYQGNSAPRKVMYRHLITNWLNYLASYRSPPETRPNEKLLRLAIRWMKWGEDDYPAYEYVSHTDEYWDRAWRTCSWLQLCGTRAAAEEFLATVDARTLYEFPTWDLPADLGDLFPPGTISPEECGQCIAKQLNYYSPPSGGRKLLQ